MNWFDILSWFKGELLKQRLLQMWISPNDIQWIDFNNVNDLNQLAEKIVPTLIKNNPMMKNIIKQNSAMLWAEKQREVCNIIDMN